MTATRHAQMTILAIDNQQDVLAQIASVASTAGFRCHCAHDAKSARKVAEQEAPDLIISDVSLSGHSGLSVCEELKQVPGMGDVPVMFLSAAQGPDIIRRAHSAGGAYFLRKPFDAPVLLELIERSRAAAHACH